MRYTHATRTTIGGRRYQEDSALAWKPEPADPALDLLAVLADGMGGHAGGALASRTVCEEFVVAFAEARGATAVRLDAALHAANAAIAGIVEQSPRLDGMGSTVIGAAFGPEGLEWISVGDSPMYLVRRGEIEVLNEDHSLAPALDQLAAEGKITPTEARNNPRRHMLRSAVSGEEMDLIDRSRRPLVLAAGDWVVLASDGIHTLDTDVIARLVTGYADTGPEGVAAALIREVEAARDAYQDNTTVLVVHVA
jgi:serine/threonine protein phosphatase PrpC